LTEYATGMGARIGHPIEHLAGGHAEELRHPKYATCIGLILRGYSDFENGKFEANQQANELSGTFTGSGGDVFVNANTTSPSTATPELFDEDGLHDGLDEDDTVSENQG